MKTLVKQKHDHENEMFQFGKLYRNKTLEEKSKGFFKVLAKLNEKNELKYRRIVAPSAGRTVMVYDKEKQKTCEMLMFASNNYLGFASHPYIREKVISAMKKYGVGLGGPPLLNGYTILMNELEERISNLKGKEDTLIFTSGYNANLGLISAVTSKNNMFLVDELSHASFFDGLKLNNTNYIAFKHNDVDNIKKHLIELDPKNYNETFICVEGVYSMDGDLANLPEILKLVKDHNAILLLDDAHGTGVLGETGGGTAEFFNVEDEIDVSMGTFSKAFALNGGFLSSDKEIIEYIRYFSRPYVFSAAMPPVLIVALLAGLDLIEKEPWRRKRVLDNTKYAVGRLSNFQLIAKPQAAIISINVPNWINIRKANAKLDRMGLFLNAIEYPAVALDDQRFRISITSEHTREDIDKLAESLEEVWSLFE